MAVAYNTASQATGNGANPSVSHTATGSDRFVLIGISAGGGAAINAISYGAQTPTLIATIGPIHLYRLTAPNTGAQTVSVTLSGVADYVLGVLSFTGVHQTTPIGTSDSQTNSELASIAATVVSETNGMVADIAYMVNDAMAADGAQTERVAVDSIEGGFGSAGMSTKAGAASATMTWTAPATFGDNYIIAVPISPSGGGGGGPGPNVPLARRFGPQSFQRTLVNL